MIFLLKKMLFDLEQFQHQSCAQFFQKLNYQTNKYFRRDGNTLIASFVYPKKLKGNIVTFPYILDNIHIPSVVLGKLSYQFDGFGFLNQKTSIKGKYVVYVTYK